MPAGLGLVTLNGIIAELGSGLFNLSVIWSHPIATWCYFIGMFISNSLVATLAVLLFFVDDMAIGWKLIYALIVLLLFALRTEGLRRAVVEHFKSDEQESDGADLAKEEAASASVEIKEPVNTVANETV